MVFMYIIILSRVIYIHIKGKYICICFESDHIDIYR